MAVAGTLEIQLLANVARLQRDMDSAKGAVGGAMASIEKSVAMAKNALMGLAGGFSAMALVGKLVSVQREFDVLNSSLITVTGSSARAKQEFVWIEKFAAKTPYSLNEVTGAFVKMKSLGLDASEKALRSYGNTASAMGHGLNQMIEAVADAATGEFERLKEFGIKAAKQGDQVSLTFQGVTTKIGNNAEEITGYLRKIGDVNFGAAMDLRAATLDGALSNLGDSWNKLFLTINQNQTGSVVADSVKLAADALVALTGSVNAIASAFVTGAKIAAAYFALFVAAPAIFAAVSTAVMFVVDAAALYAFNVITGTAATVGFNTVLFGTSVAAQLAAGSLSKMHLAASVLFAAFAGYQFGSYLSEQFVQVRVAGLAFVGAMMKGWEGVVYGANLTGAALKSLLPGTESFADAKARLSAAHQKEIDVIDDNIVEMIRYETAVKSATAAEAAADSVKKAATAATTGASKATKAQKDAITETAKALDYYNTLMAKGSGLNGDFAKNWDSLSKVYASRNISLNELTAAQAVLLAQQPAMIEAAKDQATATKAYDDALKSLQSTAASEADALVKIIAAQQQHNAEIGKTPAQVELAKQAEQERVAATIEGNASILQSAFDVATAQAGFDQATLALWQVKLDSLHEQAAMHRQIASQNATGALLKGADALSKANQKAAEASEKYWEDALMRAFESGKGFFQSLWDTIKNTLKTQVLKVSVQGVMGSLGMGAAGAAGAGAGASTAGSILGNAAGSYSVNSMLTSAFPGAMAAASTFGNAALAGVQSMVGLVGTTAQAATAAANGIAAASQIATGQAITGSAVASAGSVAAAAVPYVAAALVLYDIAQKTKGEERAGAQYGYSTNGQTLLDPFTGGSRAPATTRTTDISGAQFLHGPSGGDPYAEDVKKAIDSTVTGINTLFSRLGTEIAITSFQGGYESSGKGRGGVLAGGTLSTGATFGESGTGSNYNGDMYETTSSTSPNIEEAMKDFSTDLMQATVQALQAAVDIPQTIKEMLAGIDAESLSTEAAAQLLTDIDAVTKTVTTFNAVAKSLPFENLTDLSFDAAAGLIAAAGGMDALGANLGTYYTNFYSAEEQRAQAIKNIGSSVTAFSIQPLLDDLAAGVTPAEELRKRFRLIAESQDLTTASGQQMYAQMISVSGAFAELTPIVAGTAKVVDAAADKLQEVNQGWTDQLDILTGAETDRSIALRDATDDSTRAIMRQVYAQEDYKQAIANTQAAIDTATTALESAKAAAATAQSTVEAIRNEATGNYLSATDKVAQAQQRIADLQAKSLADAANAANAAAQRMGDFAQSLRGLVDDLTLSGAATAAASTAIAKAQFSSTLALAKSGDVSALQQVGGSGKALIDAYRITATSRVDFERNQAQVLVGLRAAAAVAEAAARATVEPAATVDPMVQALADLRTAQAAQTAAQALATRVGASLSAAVDSLAARHAAAVAAATAAAAAQAAAQQKLDLALAELQAINGNTSPLLAQLVNGFAGIDLNVDGVLTLVELKSAGLASDAVLTNLFNLTDTNQDGVISKLEAIRAAAAPLLAQLINGFAGIDLNVDGGITLAELKTAGLASDTAMANLFNLTDTNGDGMLSKLEAIRANTLITAEKIGAAVTTTITGTNTTGSGTNIEMGLQSLIDALKTSAAAQGVDQSKITTGFATGLFSQLDTNGSGGLSASEASASKITTAVATLLGQTPGTGTGTTGTGTTTPPAATLTAFDKLVLADPTKFVVTSPTTAAERVVFDAYRDYAFRKPEREGFDFWVGKYAELLPSLGETKTVEAIRKAVDFSAKAWGVTSADRERQNLTDIYIGTGMSSLGAQTLISRYFAKGGAFTNGIATSPTNFNLGQMGEAGPEAIMPLANINGSLGVRFAGSTSGNTARLERLVEALTQEVQNLRAEARATATNTGKTAKLLDRAMPDGDAMATRVAA